MQRGNTKKTRDVEDLRNRLAAAEETLQAIRSGAVDAVVVSGPEGDRLYTLAGTAHAYRVFMEAMNEGAATISADGSILYCNRYFAEMLGKPLDEVIGTRVLDLISPAEKKAFDALLRKSLESSGKSELNLVAAGGRQVPAYVSLSSFEEFGARTLCMVVTDLGEQKRNQELLAAGKLARLIMEQASEVIAVCDGEGRVLQASQGLEQICGVNPLFQTFDKIMPLRIEKGEQAAAMAAFSVTDLFAGKSVRGIEVSYQPPAAERVHFLMSASPIARQGTPVGCVITLFDIDERKRAEESLRRSEQLAATGRLAATIAHEINNPLEAVTNLLYLIETAPHVHGEVLAWAQKAQQELARVAHITRQTLGFYRESRQPQPVRIKDVIESILSLYSGKLETKEIRLDKRLECEGWVHGFHSQIGQVISNLFLNALDACPRKGKLCVRLYESREWANSQKPGVRIVIGDTGAGIRSEDRPHLFEPFFTTKGEKGTGLGLWVSQGIVARHEGAMRFRSSVRPGRSGTVFSVFLPFREHKPGRTASPQSEGHVISGQ